MTYKKGNCAEFGPVDVFWFKRDTVKPISCKRMEVIIIIIIIIIMKGIWFSMPTIFKDDFPVVMLHVVDFYEPHNFFFMLIRQNRYDLT